MPGQILGLNGGVRRRDGSSGDGTARADDGTARNTARAAVERGRRGTLGTARLVGRRVRARVCEYGAVQLWWWREAVQRPRPDRAGGQDGVLGRTRDRRCDASL
jgi:hypothetical protein